MSRDISNLCHVGVALAGLIESMDSFDKRVIEFSGQSKQNAFWRLMRDDLIILRQWWMFPAISTDARDVMLHAS